MTDAAKTDDLSGLTYEQAESQLSELIVKLEAGDVPLEDSLDMYERAQKLRNLCQAKLTDAKERLKSVDPAAAAAAPDIEVADDDAADDPWAPETTSALADEPPF